MKIDIISGFLGSGKTTLIKKLLSEELYKEKVAIIENEYGEVSIDGNLLRDEKIEVREINSGCICCSIKGDFEQSIKEIVKEYSPERIIIEPSGVAKLSEVISSVKDANITNTKLNIVATVLDVNNFDFYLKNFGEFYRNQIANAKTIFLSRVDGLKQKELEELLIKVKTLNKNAQIITTPLKKLRSDRIIEVAELPKEKLELELKIPKVGAKLRESKVANATFDNWGVETTTIFEEEKLKSILNKLAKEGTHGQVLRAKGIVPIKGGKWVQFDCVPNEVSIKAFSPDYTGRICVIGSGLKKDGLKNLFLNEK